MLNSWVGDRAGNVMVKLHWYCLRILLQISFLIMVGTGVICAQPHTQQERLMRIAALSEYQFEAEKLLALEKARQLAIPSFRLLADGRAMELMRFQDGIPVYYITHNAGGASLIRADKLYPGGDSGLNLTGADVLLGMWDSGKVRDTHQEFGGRVIQVDGASSLSNHASHVAGTLIAGGAVAQARGMAYEASLHAYDWNNDDAEMAAAAADGLRVSQHSYGFITGWHFDDGDWYWYGNINISETEDYFFGFYDSSAEAWDEIAYNAPYYLIVKSAGNHRGGGPSAGTLHYYWDGVGWATSTATRDLNGGPDGYDSMSRTATGKNLLTVGAVNASGNMTSFSSWGPTDDGRIKPDIVAKGVSVYSSMATGDDQYGYSSGTSMSGPMISGASALLLEHQQNLHPDTVLLASTLKALIIHTANDELGGAPGPDYRFGWGLMDTEKVAGVMRLNKLADGLHIIEGNLQDATQNTIELTARGGEPLRATLVWTDPPGNPPVASLNPPDLMLVNDLDMRINHSGGATWYPYVLDPANPSLAASSGDNFRDNVEVIHIEEPLAGEIYELIISHKASLEGGSQSYSLVVTGNMAEDEGPVATIPTVTTSAVSDIGITEAKGGGNVESDGGAEVTQRGLVWSAGVTPYYENHEGIEIQGSGAGHFTITMSSLTSSTTYHVRAFAINQEGTAYGQEEIFTTLAQTYTLNLQAEPSGAGDLSGDGTYVAGDTISIEANPKTGYIFRDWTGGAEFLFEPEMATNAIVMPDDDLTILARFDAVQYLITATSDGSGHIEPEGEIAIPEGGTQTFVMTAETGHYLHDVEVDGVGVGEVASYVFEDVRSNHTIHAKFKSNAYIIQVVVIPEEAGIVSGDGIYLHGEEVWLEASPDQGYRFLYWVENDEILMEAGETVTSTYVFIADTDRMLHAHFEQKQFSIEATSSMGGSIDPAGIVSVSWGDDQGFTMTASGGYDLIDVEVDGSSVGALTSYVFENIQSDHTIHAVYGQKAYVISASVRPSETGDVSGTGTFAHGAEVHLQATPLEGYRFRNWTEGGQVVLEGNQVASADYTFKALSDRALTANFALMEYTVSVDVIPDDGGFINGIGVYNHGQTASLEAHAADGFEFQYWKEDGEVLTEDGVVVSSTYSFKVENHRHFEAHFSPMEFLIHAAASAGGTIEPSGTIPVSFGQSRSFFIMPDEGYYIADVEVDGLGVGAVASYTFDDVSSDHDIYALFAARHYEVVALSEPDVGGVVSGTGTYQHGQLVTLTAIPSDDYEFVKWTENGELIVENDSVNQPVLVFYAFGDRSLLAHFEQVAFEVVFVIKDIHTSEPVSDAYITFNDVAYSSGIYSFTGVYPGSYPFLVERMGYFPYLDTVAVESADVRTDVLLVPDDTSIPEPENLVIHIYPNPASENITIGFKGHIEGHIRLDIINTRGLLIKTFRVTEEGDFLVNISGLRPGLYLIRIWSETGKSIHKFIKY